MSREKPARMARPFPDVKLQFCFSGLSLSESRGPPSQAHAAYTCALQLSPGRDVPAIAFLLFFPFLSFLPSLLSPLLTTALSLEILEKF